MPVLPLPGVLPEKLKAKQWAVSSSSMHALPITRHFGVIHWRRGSNSIVSCALMRRHTVRKPQIRSFQATIDVEEVSAVKQSPLAHTRMSSDGRVIMSDFTQTNSVTPSKNTQTFNFAAHSRIKYNYLELIRNNTASRSTVVAQS